jgi:hypothetical protein
MTIDHPDILERIKLACDFSKADMPATRAAAVFRLIDRNDERIERLKDRYADELETATALSFSS